MKYYYMIKTQQELNRIIKTKYLKNIYQGNIDWLFSRFEDWKDRIKNGDKLDDYEDINCFCFMISKDMKNLQRDSKKYFISNNYVLYKDTMAIDLI